MRSSSGSARSSSGARTTPLATSMPERLADGGRARGDLGAEPVQQLAEAFVLIDRGLDRLESRQPLVQLHERKPTPEAQLGVLGSHLHRAPVEQRGLVAALFGDQLVGA